MATPAVFLRVKEAIIEGELQLPTLPVMAMRIREALEDPDIAMSDLIRLIQIEPGLASYILRVANSPLFRGINACVDIGQALGRLGLDYTRQVATSYAVSSLFVEDHPVARAQLSRYWRQSVRLASLSSVLARLCHRNPSRALLAGLLQDVGCLALIPELVRHNSGMAEDALFDEVMASCGAKVGVLLLESWQLEDDLVEVVRSRELWQRDQYSSADLADVITIARYHLYIGTPAFAQVPPPSQIPAFSKLSVGTLNAKSSLQILDDAREEIHAIQELLSAR